MSNKVKGLVLLSGGLDSILAVKILLEQKIKITGLVFVSCFFDSALANGAAKKLGIELKIVDFSKKHFEMVKNPKYGYGKNMNPCIDCHTLMLKCAKEIMVKGGFDFIATGEVLGERPMSQNKQSLKLIEKNSGLTGYLLRPLSAKLLEPTKVEINGLVKREKLLDISGRSRKRQLAMAKKWKIDWFPTPSGGCLLTESQYSDKLKELIKHCPNPELGDIELLKTGRHFWHNNITIIVGRDHKDNLVLQKAKRDSDIILEIKEVASPTTLIRSYKGKITSGAIEKAKKLTKFYTPKAKNKTKISFSVII
ncbi:MAG: tRNA 4-thiouridine(8) synthase ThiI [Candidatus Parcubacteria bacterium]|nr:tRNA 4-thiouridine(8) synthase ThiI [Candidatus Parcubacteria bacterium]